MVEHPIMEFDGLTARRRLPDFRHASEAAADLHYLYDEIDGAQHVAGEIDDTVAREVAVEFDRFLEGEAGAVRMARAHDPPPRPREDRRAAKPIEDVGTQVSM